MKYGRLVNLYFPCKATCSLRNYNYTYITSKNKRRKSSFCIILNVIFIQNTYFLCYYYYYYCYYYYIFFHFNVNVNVTAIKTLVKSRKTHFDSTVNKNFKKTFKGKLLRWMNEVILNSVQIKRFVMLIEIFFFFLFFEIIKSYL